MKCKIYLEDGKTLARWDKGTRVCDGGKRRGSRETVREWEHNSASITVNV